GRRFDGDTAVGQRAAAHTGRLRDGHAAEEPQIEPAVESRRTVVAEEPGVARLARVVARLPAAPALEHEHTHAPLGEAARQDGAAEAAPDHNRIEPGSHCHGRGRPQRRTRISSTRTYVDGS